MKVEVNQSYAAEINRISGETSIRMEPTRESLYGPTQKHLAPDCPTKTVPCEYHMGKG